MFTFPAWLYTPMPRHRKLPPPRRVWDGPVPRAQDALRGGARRRVPVALGCYTAELLAVRRGPGAPAPQSPPRAERPRGAEKPP